MGQFVTHAMCARSGKVKNNYGKQPLEFQKILLPVVHFSWKEEIWHNKQPEIVLQVQVSHKIWAISI